MDINFKEKFNTFDDEFNIVSKLINELEEKENYYLRQLELANPMGTEPENPSKTKNTQWS